MLTNPPPVLKNRFFVPECDFSLSMFTGLDENVQIDVDVGRVSRDEEAIGIDAELAMAVAGRKRRVKSDIVVRVDGRTTGIQVTLWLSLKSKVIQLTVV